MMNKLNKKYQLLVVLGSLLAVLVVGLLVTRLLKPSYPKYMTKVNEDIKQVGSHRTDKFKDDKLTYVFHYPKIKGDAMDSYIEEIDKKYRPQSTPENKEEILIDYESYQVNDTNVSVLFTISKNEEVVAHEGRVLNLDTQEFSSPIAFLNQRGARKLSYDLRTSIGYKNNDIPFLHATDMNEAKDWAMSQDIITFVVNQKRYDYNRSELANYFSDSDGEDIPSVYLDKGTDPKEKLVALTFDDGPHYAYTKQVLDTLDKHNAKGTFFMLGSRVAGQEALLRRSLDSGHQLANHSFSHKNFNANDQEVVASQIFETNQEIKRATGLESKIMIRPPYGNANEEVLKNNDHTFVNWTVDSYDWHDKDASKICSVVKNHVFDGSIVLMHDIYQTSADALDCFVEDLVNEGYKLVTVEELLKSRLTEIKTHSIYYRAKLTD